MPDWLRRVVDLLAARGGAPSAGDARTPARGTVAPRDQTGHSHTDQSCASQAGSGRATFWPPASPGGPLRDHVFVGFMFGARRDPLWLRAPQFLARVFGREVRRFTPSSDVSPARALVPRAPPGSFPVVVRLSSGVASACPLPDRRHRRVRDVAARHDAGPGDHRTRIDLVRRDSRR